MLAFPILLLPGNSLHLLSPVSDFLWHFYSDMCNSSKTHSWIFAFPWTGPTMFRPHSSDLGPPPLSCAARGSRGQTETNIIICILESYRQNVRRIAAFQRPPDLFNFRVNLIPPAVGKGKLVLPSEKKQKNKKPFYSRESMIVLLFIKRRCRKARVPCQSLIKLGTRVVFLLRRLNNIKAAER